MHKCTSEHSEQLSFMQRGEVETHRIFMFQRKSDSSNNSPLIDGDDRNVDVQRGVVRCEQGKC